MRMFVIKIKNLFLFIFFSLALISCGKEPQSINNSIKELSNVNPEIPILNWRIIGPFNDTTNADRILTLASPLHNLNHEIEQKDLIDTLYKQQKGFVIDFADLYGDRENSVTYALSVITTDKAGEVAFLVGVDDNIRLWVNDALCLTTEGSRGLRKNQFVEKIFLEEGDNVIIAEISNGQNEWEFSLEVATIEHVRYNALIFDYYGNCVNPLLSSKDSLEFRISDFDFLPATRPSKLTIYDFDDDRVMEQTLALDKYSKVSLKGLKEGVYRYTLVLDADTLDGFFAYGGLDKVYHRDKILEKYRHNKQTFDLLSPYVKRSDHLIASWVTNAKRQDIELERKIVYCIYKILEIVHKATKGPINESMLSGLQLKSYISPIDGSEEYYIIYIPKVLKESASGMPLMVAVPYVTGKHKLYVGAIMANSNRMSYISKFAEERGIAVLWTSARIFEKYNMTPIVTRSIEDNICHVSNIYPIDKDRVYLYGDCSGGLFALLSAIRRPDLFAAIAVEGPDLAPVNFTDETADLSGVSNNLFAMSENIEDKPILFLQSKNDYKSQPSLTRKLIDRLKKKKGRIEWDDQREAAKGTRIVNGMLKHYKMISEPESMRKVFDFFYSLNRDHISPVRKFSTYAVYRDTVYGVYIAEKNGVGIADVEYSFQNNILDIKTSNVAKFSFNTQVLDCANLATIQIRWNGQLIPAQALTIVGEHEFFLQSAHKTEAGRQHVFARKKTQIPINAVFRERFALVLPEEPDKVSLRAIHDFDSLWQEAYGVEAPIILSSAGISQMSDKHLIYFDNHDESFFSNWIQQTIDVEEEAISFRSRYKGNRSRHISYAYTEPLNANYFCLRIGTAGSEIAKDFLENLIYNGWQSFVFWDNIRKESVFEMPRFY